MDLKRLRKTQWISEANMSERERNPAMREDRRCADHHVYQAWRDFYPFFYISFKGLKISSSVPVWGTPNAMSQWTSFTGMIRYNSFINLIVDLMNVCLQLWRRKYSELVRDCNMKPGWLENFCISNSHRIFTHDDLHTVVSNIQC